MTRDPLGERQARDLAVHRVARAAGAACTAGRAGGRPAAGATWPRHRHAVGVRLVEQLELPAPAVAAHLQRARTTAAGPTPRPCAGRSRTRRRRRRSRRRPAARRWPVAPIARAMPTSSSASAVSVGVNSPLLRAVVERARRREAERAGLDRLARERGHRARCRRGVAVSRRAPRSPITCSRSAPCGTCTRDVDVEGPAVERVHELGERLPVPREALVQHRAGDVLDAFHQLDEPLVVGGAHRREADAAVADDDGGDAVPRRRDHALAPRRLAVVVAVDVDEAGRDEQAVGVDRRASPRRRPSPTSVIDAVVDRDVGRARRRAGAVDDGAARG